MAVLTGTPAMPRPKAREHRQPLSPRTWIVVLSVIALTLIGLYVGVGLAANPEYLLPRRFNRVLTMVLVAYCVGISTVLFQTVTANRILTPSIMGFDALYLLIQTSLVFTIGSSGLAQVGELPRFLAELVLMVGFSWVIYGWLFTGTGRSLHLVLLIGIVLGTMFRGISALMQRLLEPSEFLVVQDAMFASFVGVSDQLLRISLVLIALASLGVVVLWRQFDVLALGRDTAVSLGVSHTRTVTGILVICSVFVGVCTALVGPITFFGLIVANLAYALGGSFRHRMLLPIAVLLGVIALVGGQLVLERVFSFDTALSIVIEFVGGLLFLYLLLRGTVKG